MNNSHKMNSIQYFLWLSMQAFGGVLIIPGPLFFAVLLLAVSSAAIYECAFCDTNSLWVFIFFANPVFVLIGGTLGINVKAPPQIRSSLDTEQNVTWHQTIVRKDGPNFKKEETWHQSIIHFIDLRGRQIFELVIAAGILAHFVALSNCHEITVSL